MTSNGNDTRISESKDNLGWLFTWYGRCCNGIWEHTHGLRLERFEHPSREARQRIRQVAGRTPGWQLTIELAGVPVPRCAPRTLLLDTTDGGWLTCSLTPERFIGSGDAERVEQIVGVFRRWIEPARMQSRFPAPPPSQFGAPSESLLPGLVARLV